MADAEFNFQQCLFLLEFHILQVFSSRTPRRRNLDVKERDQEIEKGQAGLLDSTAIDTLLFGCT